MNPLIDTSHPDAAVPPSASYSVRDNESSRPVASGLRQRVAAGFSYFIAQSLAVKGLNFGAQLLLAWILAPRDFGLAGLGLTILSFADLVQRSGVKDVLIHRHKRIGAWVAPGLSMTLAMGCAASVLLVAAAAPMAHVTGKPELRLVLWILAASVPLNAVSTVLQAVLEAQLKFRFVAAVTFGAAIVQTALSVLLALRGWGAIALIVPIPAAQAVRIACLSRHVGITWPRSLGVRRWRYLYSHTAITFSAYALSAFIWQGDYLLLGLYQSEEGLGYYYFAFNLSLQFVLLLTGNLGTALFPALANISHEPERLLRAYLSAARLVAYVGVPLSIFQAVVASPAIHLFFGSKWSPAAPIMQVLCIGMAIRLVEWTSESLLKAQGRFTTFLTLTASHAFFFGFGVTVASRYGTPLTVAVVVSALLIAFGPIRILISIRPLGAGLAELRAILLRPLVASVAAAAVAFASTFFIHFSSRAGAFALCAVEFALFAATYVALTWRSSPDEVRQIALRLERAVSQSRG